jgi:hypothetical protein
VVPTHRDVLAAYPLPRPGPERPRVDRAVVQEERQGQGHRDPGRDGPLPGADRLAPLLPRHRYALGHDPAGGDRGLPTFPASPRAHGLSGTRSERILVRRDGTARSDHEGGQYHRSLPCGTMSTNSPRAGDSAVPYRACIWLSGRREHRGDDAGEGSREPARETLVRFLPAIMTKLSDSLHWGSDFGLGRHGVRRPRVARGAMINRHCPGLRARARRER